MARKLRVTITPARNKQFRIKIIGRNGEPLFVSETLHNLGDAEQTVVSMLKDIIEDNCSVEITAGKFTDQITPSVLLASALARKKKR